MIRQIHHKKPISKFKILSAVILLIVIFATKTSNQTQAVVVGFNPGNIISDSIFTNKSSMTVDQIQQFLNSKMPACDTYGQKLDSRWAPDVNGDGKIQRWEYGKYRYNQTTFPCLRDYKIADGRSAAQLIYDTAQKYTINPQVLIVLLQKEQTLVTDDWPVDIQYRSATGYGCPDTAACNAQYYGLANQVDWSGKMFRAILNDSPTWYTPYELGNNYIQYNPQPSCGGSWVNIENRSTQALYNYTPYQPNQATLNADWGTAYCGAYGNRNFFLYFTSWFGPTDKVNIPNYTNNEYYGGNNCDFLSPTPTRQTNFCNGLLQGKTNNDDFNDIVLASSYSDQSFNIWSLLGGNNSNFEPLFHSHLSKSNGWDLSKTKMVMGDLNNDTFEDLTLLVENTSGGIDIWQATGSAGGFQPPTINTNMNVLKYPDIAGWWWNGLHVFNETGDFNGDTFQDVALISIFPDKKTFNLWVLPGSSSGFLDPVFQQNFSFSNAWDLSKNKFFVADSNSDGISDLLSIASNNYGGLTFVQIYGNSSNILATPPIISTQESTYKSTTGWYWDMIDIIKPTGDFNKDGQMEIAVVSVFPDKESFNLWLFPINKAGIQNPIFQQHFSNKAAWVASRNKFVAIDINNDSTDDLISIADNNYGGLTLVEITGSELGLTSQPRIIVNPDYYKSDTGWFWKNIN